MVTDPVPIIYERPGRTEIVFARERRPRKSREEYRELLFAMVESGFADYDRKAGIVWFPSYRDDAHETEGGGGSSTGNGGVPPHLRGLLKRAKNLIDLGGE